MLVAGIPLAVVRLRLVQNSDRQRIDYLHFTEAATLQELLREAFQFSEHADEGPSPIALAHAARDVERARAAREAEARSTGG